MSNKAFSLVELMIVVAILGILAAIVIPQIQGQTLLAKESAAKDTLRTWRAQIELYKMQHGGLQPGYKYNIFGTKSIASPTELINQLTGTSDKDGNSSSSQVPTGPYIYGPYLQSIPANPFNTDKSILIVSEGTAFGDVADGESSGWLYKRETAEIRLNWPAADNQSVNYSDY